MPVCAQWLCHVWRQDVPDNPTQQSCADDGKPQLLGSSFRRLDEFQLHDRHSCAVCRSSFQTPSGCSHGDQDTREGLQAVFTIPTADTKFLHCQQFPGSSPCTGDIDASSVPGAPRPFLLLRRLRVRDSSPATTCVLSSSRAARAILPSNAPARRTLPVKNHFPTRLPALKPTNAGAAGTLGCGAIIHNWSSKSSPRPLLRRSAYNPPRHATCLPRRRQLTLRRRTSWPSFRPPYL